MSAGGGYRRRPKLKRLTWVEEHHLHGLEVVVRPVKLRLIREVMGVLDDVKAGNVEAIFSVVVPALAEVIVEWNMVDAEGNPVPPTVETLLDDDIDFLTELLDAWMDTIGAVPAPLERKSTDGDSSKSEELALSIPMEIPSDPRPS